METGYKLFLRSDASPYARCFTVFTKSLLKDTDWLNSRRDKLIIDLNNELYACYQERIHEGTDWRFDKPFLQLFCFTLSALNISDKCFMM